VRRPVRFRGAKGSLRVSSPNPKKVIRGYVRVSTDGQSVDAQVRQLKASSAEKVWRETASGAKTDRAQLRRVLAQLNAGDVLMVTRLDRLAPSTRDLLNRSSSIAQPEASDPR
jgi:DNA invertase Pin-like site-specific DNA recombinase